MLSTGLALTRALVPEDFRPGSDEYPCGNHDIPWAVRGDTIPLQIVKRMPDDPVKSTKPTFTADRGWLHLEARYNYEALDTASAWGGFNFSGGEILAFEFTPMLGAVFGDITGVAPGYKGSLTWWKLELYSEGEYVFDTGSSSDSFFSTTGRN